MSPSMLSTVGVMEAEGDGAGGVNAVVCLDGGETEGIGSGFVDDLGLVGTGDFL